MKNNSLNKKSIFFATFSHYKNGERLPTSGMIAPMLSYFAKHVKEFTMLEQPHPVSDTIDPVIEIYKKGKLKKRTLFHWFYYLPIYIFCRVPSKKTTRIPFKLRDFFSVIFVVLFSLKKYDLFVGLESINALAGILLKKLGRVDTVIYYVSDYAPQRYGKTWFNSLYLWLDRFCVRHADFTWDVSPAIQEARIEAGLEKKLSYKVIHVPNGLFPEQMVTLPIKKRIAKSLVYMGILDRDQGPDFAIRCLIPVLKKIPSTHLHIIGGVKEDVDTLKRLVNSLHLEKNVTLYGYIKDNEEMAKLVRRCMVGLAPYRSFPDSFRWWGDAGKIRQYIAAGLPVVTTHVPPLGRYISDQGAAVMRKDTIEEYSQGIIKLLTDKKLYEKLATQAEKISRKNTWEKVYNTTIQKMDSITRQKLL